MNSRTEMGNNANTAGHLRRILLAIASITSSAALATPAMARGQRAAGSAGAGSGGAGLIGVSPGSPPPESTTTPVTHLVSVPVSVSGHGLTLVTRASGETGMRLVFTGTARGAAGRTIVIQDHARGRRGWRRVTRATVGAGGTFVARVRIRRCGRLRFRAALLAADATGSISSSGPSPSGSSRPRHTPGLAVTIFRTGRATIYGPGFWGHRTACGRALWRHTLGVASRTLRCGTRVAVYFGGREIVVPVIDRGPFGPHPARWDLTLATATALGIRSTARVGTLIVR